MFEDQQFIQQLESHFTPEQGVTIGKWFGRKCLKAKQVFAVFYEGDMAFKLDDLDREDALQHGACVFDPRQKGSPMKEWVLIPKSNSSLWESYARRAFIHVSDIESKRKRAVISRLASARSQILNAVSLLKPGQEDEVYLGNWDVKDLLAHLEGWDYANIQAAQAILEGQLPSFYGFRDNDWKSYNDRLVNQYKIADLAELVESVKATNKCLLDLMETIPAEYFDRDFGVRYRGYKVTIGRLIEAEGGDEEEHYLQLVDYFG